MTVKQGQKVQFLEVHPEQSLWWHVREQNGGNTGYVPASYMLVCARINYCVPCPHKYVLNFSCENKKSSKTREHLYFNTL